MSVERLFITDPYNDEHLEMLKEFEKNNGIISHTMEYIGKIRTTFTKEEYIEAQKQSNTIEEILFIEKDLKINDYCHIQGEKDIRSCRISFPTLKNKEKKRRILLLATKYAQETLNFQEVFINIPKEDKNLMVYLDTYGFEDLGEESGKIIYLKEKEEIKEIQRKIA